MAARTTITLTTNRADQLRAIAAARGLANPGVLLEHWIARSIAEGEIPAGTPGFLASRVADRVVVAFDGTTLPALTVRQARLFAALLSAAAGEADPELTVTLPEILPGGRGAVLQIEGATLTVAQAGQGVKVLLKPESGPSAALKAPPRFAAELADTIRSAIANH